MTAIELDDVGKRYVKYEDAPTLMGRAMRLRGGTRRSELWAIRHVDLEVPPGETIAVIGRNGSGKSTLLGMLAGVTAPTEGRVRVQGRVAPLISVGVGFHPELTGRENVFVNGTILGMQRSEIAARLEAILDFSEIRDFIDTPVKFYSSGMFVRLGFSVAVAADPDVLLVDEVLAVGDIAFQGKCFDRMRALQEGGTTIFVVSHNLNAVRNLCSRALLVHDGTPRFLGSVEEAISRYHTVLEEARLAESGDESPQIELLDFRLHGVDGAPTGHVRSGDEICLRLRVRFLNGATDPVFGVRIVTESGQTVYAESTLLQGTRTYDAGEEEDFCARLTAHLPTGSYQARGYVRFGPGNDDDDVRAGSAPAMFFVAGRRMVKGVADLRAQFELGDGQQGRSRARSRPSE